MQKTKLGMTIGMLSAIVYFTALFGGYIPLFVLVGYILLFEQNDWLRRVSFKAVILSMVFSIITVVISLVPQALGCISNFLSIFGVHFSISIISTIVNILISIVGIVETVLFLMLGVKAYKMQDVKIAKIEKFMEE